jgi:hypothetical protein
MMNDVNKGIIASDAMLGAEVQIDKGTHSIDEVSIYLWLYRSHHVTSYSI